MKKTKHTLNFESIYHYFNVNKKLKFISGTYYSFKRYVFLRDRPPTDVNVNSNLSVWVDTVLHKPNTWLYSGIVVAILLVVMLLVVLVLRKRIVIAIALVKEGSKYVKFISISTICLQYNNIFIVSEL